MQSRFYELMMVMPDANGQKEVESMVNGLLEKGGGKVLGHDFWGKRQLAYPILKQNKAVYGCFTLEMVPAEVLDLQKRLRIQDGILRSLLVVKNEQKKEAKKSKTKLTK